jgi:hypothetical protein
MIPYTFETYNTVLIALIPLVLIIGAACLASCGRGPARMTGPKLERRKPPVFDRTSC